MHARVTSFTAESGKIDEIIKVTRDSVLPTLKKHKGFKNLLYLTNRDTNKCTAVVLWDTEADMMACETSAYDLLGILFKTAPLSTQPPTRDHYEVSIQG